MKIVKCEKPLKLRNDGQLEIVFIGCGTAFGKELYNNNIIIIKGNTHILVDFGMTGPTALRKNTGLDIPDVENILITHSHADHIGGLEYFALYHRYVAQRFMGKHKPKMIISDEYEKILWNMSLSGGMEWNETSSGGKKLAFSDYFEPVRPKIVKNRQRITLDIKFNDIQLEIFGTNHIPENAETQSDAFLTYGIFIDDRIFFTGDTKFDRELIDTYKDKSKLIFHDASFGLNPVHASVDQLRTLPNEVRKKIYLMHYGDDWRNHNVSDFGGLAKQGYRYIFY